MRQLSLLSTTDHSHLAGLIPALRAALRRACSGRESVGRKALVDEINDIAREGGVRLTSGNASALSKDLLDKMLAGGDVSHPPSIIALVVIMLATGDLGPLRVIARAVGAYVVTEDDLKDIEYGRACRMEREARRTKKRLEATL